jgi:hypothetical protein
LHAALPFQPIAKIGTPGRKREQEGPFLINICGWAGARSDLRPGVSGFLWQACVNGLADPAAPVQRR